MAVFSGPFDPLPGLQQALDAFRTSGWLDDAGPSGGGAFPPINVFRKGDEFLLLVCHRSLRLGLGPPAGGGQFTWIVLGLSCAARGSSSARMPSRHSAFTAAASISTGRATARSNRPPSRSRRCTPARSG